MEYQQAAQWAAQHLESYRKDPSGWSGCKRSNNITISWRPSNVFRGNLYRAEGILAAKPKNVLKCIMPETGGLREKWDDNVTKLAVVESINSNVCVLRTTTPSVLMNMISPREFLDVVLVQENEDGSKMTAATNVEHHLSPPQPNYVRGLNFPCGCFLIPVPGDPNKTHLLSFFQTDLGGSLPQKIIESFFPRSITGFYGNLANAAVTLVA
ncbi:stAR-related lipid transfer protein 5 [Pseudonaja textilis]|uniref:StAR related lipid transfer domain containing 5 n=1 Tax=Pseudonaja textilis TaxID=8673 RepID=A0A670Y799_PSETE|nr:stAR-related lipid transfer protein 5 [Pseudonaja textilis]